jgi:hypothetical protein
LKKRRGDRPVAPTAPIPAFLRMGEGGYGTDGLTVGAPAPIPAFPHPGEGVDGTDGFTCRFFFIMIYLCVKTQVPFQPGSGGLAWK